MATSAAVLSGVGQPLTVRHDVEVEPPRAEEIRIHVAACGVCRSDLSMQDGTTPVPMPVVLGHEASAVVLEVGAGVTDLAPGDHVVVSWVPQCGECFFCQRGQRHLCRAADAVLLAGGLPEGSPRLRLDGAPLFQMCGAGAYATETVMSAHAAVKVPDDIPLDVAALMGCAVLTGVGAALNTAAIAPGDAVAVVGCGGVGLNVIQGARIAGAEVIVAIDVHPAKLDTARAFGATHTVDASRTDPANAVRDLTGQRGADVAFEALGHQGTIEQTVEMTRRGGQAVLVGIPGLEVMLTLPVFLGYVLQERTIKGCWYGSADIRRDIPRLVELYRDGRLRLDELISRRIGLDGVNDALAAMKAGEVARSVIVY
ncbi:MAG TPA: Zn-dependent alcohol dehydrogenase [Acidimicrobiales bacterium]|nr:Zn-dependent alcohol dehydrogenase [Acidimicrobiales bacterium]